MGVSVSLSVALFWVLLASVGAGRLGELRLSRRHQRDLQARGARPVPDPRFRWMVALHTGVLVAAAAEAWLLHRPLIPALAAGALALAVLASLLRWWVIATLGTHWNVQIVASTGLGVVTGGPFRWVRHPNYVAVFVELAALPLVHTAWLTATVGAALHLMVLHRRIVLEESVLLADAAYHAAMGGKPRFLPRMWGRPGRRPDAPPSQTWPTSTS